MSAPLPPPINHSTLMWGGVFGSWMGLPSFSARTTPIAFIHMGVLMLTGIGGFIWGWVNWIILHFKRDYYGVGIMNRWSGSTIAASVVGNLLALSVVLMIIAIFTTINVITESISITGFENPNNKTPKSRNKTLNGFVRGLPFGLVGASVNALSTL